MTPAEKVAALVNELVALAPQAGLYIGIRIEPARDTDGTRSAATACPARVPKDCQAGAEGIAKTSQTKGDS